MSDLTAYHSAPAGFGICQNLSFHWEQVRLIRLPFLSSRLVQAKGIIEVTLTTNIMCQNCFYEDMLIISYKNDQAAINRQKKMKCSSLKVPFLSSSV